MKIIGIGRILDIVLTLATYNTPYEEKGTQVFARIFGIITCQVNGNYYAVRRNNEFLADQINPNAKNYVVLAHTKYFRGATTITPQSTLMRSKEYNIIALFFSAKELCHSCQHSKDNKFRGTLKLI